MEIIMLMCNGEPTTLKARDTMVIDSTNRTVSFSRFGEGKLFFKTTLGTDDKRLVRCVEDPKHAGDLARFLADMFGLYAMQRVSAHLNIHIYEFVSS